jgi:hypothetical protein
MGMEHKWSLVDKLYTWGIHRHRYQFCVKQSQHHMGMVHMASWLADRSCRLGNQRDQLFSNGVEHRMGMGDKLVAWWLACNLFCASASCPLEQLHWRVQVRVLIQEVGLFSLLFLL